MEEAFRLQGGFMKPDGNSGKELEKDIDTLYGGEEDGEDEEDDGEDGLEDEEDEG